MKNKLDETHETAHRILVYLMKTPGAKDTIEGITGWWLMQQNLKRKVSQIRKTVEELILKGFLLEHEGHDSTKYYQVNKERLQEISALVEAG